MITHSRFFYDRHTHSLRTRYGNVVIAAAETHRVGRLATQALNDLLGQFDNGRGPGKRRQPRLPFDAARCSAITRRGLQCSRRGTRGWTLCAQHSALDSLRLNRLADGAKAVPA